MGEQGIPAAAGSTWETSWLEVGVSLPPRKRLLAGLKQNGWLSSPAIASASLVSAWQTTPIACSGSTAEVKLEVDLDGAKTIAESEKSEVQDQCADSHEKKSKATEARDTSENLKNLKDGKSEIDISRSSFFFPTLNSVPSVDKKPRMCRELRNSNREFSTEGTSTVVSAYNSSLQHSGTKRNAMSPQEVMAAAKLTAAMAAKTAAEAKTTASEKAAVAAKAAAVAKAALEAVGIAARDEARYMRRKSVRGRFRGDLGNVKIKKKELREEREQSGVLQMPVAINDEELARQLHRAINSSPRILRSQTPLQQNNGGKLLESAEWVKGSSLPRTRQGKYQHTRLRSSSLQGGKKQEVKIGKKNSKRSHSGYMGMDPQIMSDLIKDTITSPKCELAGDSTTDIVTSQEQSENVHVGMEGSPVKPSTKEEQTKNFSLIGLHSGSFPLLSPNKAADLHTVILVDGSKQMGVRDGFSGSSEVGDGEDLEQFPAITMKEEGIVTNEERMMEIERNMKDDDTSFSKSSGMINRKDAEDTQKESNMPTQTIYTTTEGPSLTVARVEEEVKQEAEWNITCCRLAGGDNTHTSVLKESIMKDQRYVNNSANIGSELEDENMKRSTGYTKGCSSAEDSIAEPERSMIKRKSLDYTSKAASKGLSHVVQGVSEGSSLWHEGILRGLPSGAESFGGSIKINTFRSTPPVPLRTPTFASGSRRRS